MIRTIIYSNKGVIGITSAKNLLLIAIILVAISFLMGCQKQASPGDGNTQIANPSATYCVEQGNEYIIKTAADGSQSGICKFKDGTACDGWAYYRKECGAETDATEPDRQNGSATGAGNLSATGCTTDSDCVPAECCHPTTCINVASKGVCNMMCTMECRPGTLDCGQGSCRCASGKCEALIG
jgi:putative hemolysin